mmetsp:Transcript_35241/g.75060  ORF Transcript_35241/g.75060 Transcript_35241/m.75060 type:complete len:365 (-) Transcript_35241:96-1190(-)
MSLLRKASKENSATAISSDLEATSCQDSGAEEGAAGLSGQNAATPEAKGPKARPTQGWARFRCALNWRSSNSAAADEGGTTDAATDAGDAKAAIRPIPFDPACRAFDIADELEGGYAKESPSDFTTPLRKASRLWRFRVRRSEDRLSARLLSETGDFLMFALTSLEERTVSFYLYDPDAEREKALYNKAAPAFSMTFNKQATEWHLVQEQCENCQLAPAHLSCSRYGKQQLAVIRHTRDAVGEGISNVMEVTIPGIYTDGRALVWCPMLGRGCLSHLNGQLHETQKLVTKLPVWNEHVESLVLDFKGRYIMSSAKNFQLALSQKPEHVLCQFGKLSEAYFGLDFKFPLSVVQAFAIAISTMFWV